METNRQTPPNAVCPTEYEIRHLTEAQVSQAFPLVREIAGTLSIAQWQQYAARLLVTGKGQRREAGIIAAIQHGSIYIRGLVVYHLFPDLMARDRLIAGCFAVPETIDCDSVARQLIAACQAVAEERACGTVQIQLVERNRWIIPLLRNAGYVVDDTAFVRPMAPPSLA